MKKFIVISIFFWFLFSLHPLNAQTWSPPTRLTWTSGNSYYPNVLVSSNNHVHVIWSDSTPGNTEIFHKKSLDTGASWAVPNRLTWGTHSSYSPNAVFDTNGNIQLIWINGPPANYEIFHRKSTDEGISWSARTQITWNSKYTKNTAIAAGTPNFVHILWNSATATSGEEIYYKRSSDGGGTWSVTNRLTYNSGQSAGPKIAVQPGNILHVVWNDFTPGRSEIFYKRSMSGGTYWSSLLRLTWSAGNSMLPNIEADSTGVIHLIWAQEITENNTDLFYKRSFDYGVTWSAPSRLTWNSGCYNYTSDIGVDTNGIVHIVWDDDTSGRSEIYHKQSTDRGLTWSSSSRLSWNSGYSENPAIGYDGNNDIHIGWSDSTPGNHEIMYKNRK